MTPQVVSSPPTRRAEPPPRLYFCQPPGRTIVRRAHVTLLWLIVWAMGGLLTNGQPLRARASEGAGARPRAESVRSTTQPEHVAPSTPRHTLADLDPGTQRGIVDANHEQQVPVPTWTPELVTLPPPGAFGKSTPSDGATSQPTSVILGWTASSGATAYEYCYDTTNDNACTTWTSVSSALSAGVSGAQPGHDVTGMSGRPTPEVRPIAMGAPRRSGALRPGERAGRPAECRRDHEPRPWIDLAIHDGAIRVDGRDWRVAALAAVSGRRWAAATSTTPTQGRDEPCGRR